MNQKIKVPSFGTIALKIIGIFLIGFVLYTLGSSMLEDVTYYRTEEEDLAEKVRWCDRSYYERDYADLVELLTLYELRDEEFDIYWEMTDAYIDYEQYKQWKKSEVMGISGSDKRVREYEEKLRENAKNCKFGQNRRQIERYLEVLSE